MSIEASYSDLPDTTMYYKAGEGNRLTAVIQDPGDPELRIENLKIQIFADRGAELAVRTADGRAFTCKVPLVEEKKEVPILPADPNKAVEVYVGRRVFPEPNCNQRLSRYFGRLAGKAVEAGRNGRDVVLYVGPPLVRGTVNTVATVAKAGYYGSEILGKAAYGALYLAGKVTGAILEEAADTLLYDVKLLREHAPVLLGAAAVGAYHFYRSQG